MTREDLYYDSRDEITKIHAVRWIPDGKPKAILQIVHGMQEYAARYEAFATYMAEQGYLVIANDHLGHGLSATKETYGYFCHHDAATVLVRDVHRLKKNTQQEYPNIPIFIMGHSMGSFILRNYLFMYGSGIQGAIILGTGLMPGTITRFGRLFCNVWKLFGRDHKPSAFINKCGFGHYCDRIESPRTSMDWLTVSERNVDAYLADELCGIPFTVNGYHTLFTLVGRAQNRKAIRNMRKDLPILIFSGGQDPVGHYGADPRRLYEMFRAQGMDRTELCIFPEARHEVLNEDDPAPAYKKVYDWVESAILDNKAKMI